MSSGAQTIVLITGANQGIGYHVAKQLAAHENYLVLLGSRNPKNGQDAAAEIDSSGKTVQPITIDVTDDTSIQQAAEQVESRYGRLDVLINNAGISLEMAHKGEGRDENHIPTLSEKRQIWRDTYEANLFGAAITTEAFTPLLEKSTATPARIVFVSSHTGSLGLRTDPSTSWFERMSSASFPVYRSSKAAMNMLTLHYAALFRERGWKVNASCPNLTNTNFTGNRGIGRPPSASAMNIVRLATLGKDGETGQYSDELGVVPW
ncbi:hypothetical protein N7468_002103 [Penicillium chermesinum]|uniref:Uncharacterized protein n=1 Tax=Penicillium chermesinum TaxID=63820 RepID=A0A9W9TXA2_9EURO|nr:uncharacterized protein N7468_002103 [Penicillium chermesinum]KAJ5247120.1 hypothetical protein N7468_002103 [Penicillium chermesinum]KAJ6145369.1 hypothetical protein N7470_009264 [Penicillium chermesinum]